jgi:galactoside O-acetyltransferase
VGALSLVTRSLEAWGVYVGAPARRVKTRSKKLLELEKELLESRGRS